MPARKSRVQLIPRAQRAIDPSMGYLTSNDLAYGLRRMKGTADVYEKMLQVTQPRPADNQTFKSMWGDALKTGDLSLWKETCLGSTNQKYNNEVFPPEKLRENPHAKAARATFLKWMADSRMYFRDLMPWEQAQVRAVAAAPLHG